MKLDMHVSEFEWREVDHNQFSGRTSSILLRGRVWSKHQESRIVASDINQGWFYSDVPQEIDDLILETNRLIEIDLMDRNIIPKHWPSILTSSESPEDDYPFSFKLEKTVLIDPEFTLHNDDSRQQSYVIMNIFSRAHGSLKSECNVVLLPDHLKKVFKAVDELL